MEQRFLYEKLNVVKELGQLKDIPEIIEKGLAPHIHLREYQEEAFRYFITYFEEENLRKNKQIHNLFHMATGSGKTRTDA
jgi:type III restriction enzyme